MMRSAIRAILAGGVALLSLGAAAAPERADLLIRGGTIYPGGGVPFIGDVAVRGDRIVAVSPHLSIAAARTIEAKGMVVSPGFIDPHTHMGADLASDDPAKRLIPMFLLQGVTTAFIGNDGGGAIDVASVLAGAKARPVGINYATYTGFGTIRHAVIGEAKRDPTPVELTTMQAMVAKAMCEGALGLSTGLFYAPQSFSKTPEVVALTKIAAQHGGYYDSHIRDESSYTVGLVPAIDEEIEIARQAHIPAHVSHIKALGVDVWGKSAEVIRHIDAARAQGLDITASQYPWSASGTSLVASLIPLWAQDGGRPALLQRFDVSGLTARLRADIAEDMRRRGGAGKLLIVEGQFRGKTLAQVAKDMGKDPIDAAIAAIRIGDAGVVSFNMNETDIAAFMRQPWVMTDSDASPGHPRVYGTFARKYDQYVKTDHVITLREFIDRSAALPADWFHLAGRGHLKAGAFADIVVLDPKTYAARATYEQPTLYAQGVQTVVVNGRVAVDNGKLTGVAAGRALPHAPTPGSCP